MCGHFGWAIHTNVRQKQLAVMGAIMGMEMESRGNQSFGYYQPNIKTGPKDPGRIVKATGAISDKVSAIDLARSSVLIGHTRQATTGAITPENSHPFLVEGKEIPWVVGAHNGTVRDHDLLNKTYSRKFQVDSQHIFGHIADGLDLGDIEGYGAIVYVRSDEPRRVYMGRFNSGQLAIWGIGPKDRTTGIVWASTTAACTRALTMAGIKDCYPYECKDDVLYFVERGRLYFVRDEKGGEQKIPIQRFITKTYTTGNSTSFPQGWIDGADWERDKESWRKEDDKRVKSFNKFREKKAKKKDDDTLPIPPLVCDECNEGVEDDNEAKPTEKGWVCGKCFEVFAARVITNWEETTAVKEDERLPAVYSH